MRRTSAWVVVVGVLAAWACPPAAARAGVWVTLAAGVPGGSPTSDGQFWFDSPHAPPQVAITALTGGATATATTGGGSTFFGGAGVPVLLDLGNGSAYVAGGDPSQANVASGLAGGGTGPASSVAPVAGGEIPSAAALLGIALGDPAADGSRALTATVTDGAGGALGTGSITLPDGGWWVLGLTPGANTPPGPIDPPPPPPGPIDPPPGPVDPPPPPPPPPPGPGDGGPVATPEPSTLVLVGIGTLAAGVVRRKRARAA